MRVFRILTINIVLSVSAVALVAFLLRIDRLWLLPLPTIMGMMAWPFFVMGTILIVSAVIMLFKHSVATGLPGDPTNKLVSEGIYRWIRNPIYAGDILLLFGVSFYTRSLLLFLLALVSIPVLHLVVCLIEEPKTEERLGDDYRKYKQNVPRWFPRIYKRSQKKTNKT